MYSEPLDSRREASVFSKVFDILLESSDDDQELPSLQDVDPYNSHLARTFVPITAQRLTEQETNRQSINE